MANQEDDETPLLKPTGSTSREDRRDSTQKISTVTLLCFAVGGMPYQATNTAINFFISIFLLEVAQLQPYQVSVIVLVGKVWDAFTDPVCGLLVARTNTRFGRLKPWIFISTPFGIVLYFLLWYVPDIPRSYYLPWYTVVYCLFQTCLTAFHVPYTSLTMFLSNDSRQRDRATAVRMFAETIGVLLAVTVQGQLVNSVRGSRGCGGGTPTSEPKKQEGAYMLSTLILCGLYLISALMVVFGVKERQGDVVADQHNEIFKAMKLVFSHGPYVKLMFAFLFVSLAIAIVQGNLALFYTHTLEIGNQFATLILVLLICSIVLIPFWQWFLSRYGKKTAFATGIIVLIVILFCLLYINDNLIAAYALASLAGISISVAFLLPWSMLPDTMDEFMLKTGDRKDTIFYAFYVFLSKAAAGISLGLSQLALQIGGYQTGACSQSDSVGLTLRMLVSPCPIVFLLIALIFLAVYPITEERRRKTQQALLDRACGEPVDFGTSSGSDLTDSTHV